MRNQNLLRHSIVTALLLLLPHLTYAANTDTWNGGSGNWTGNWTAGANPGAGTITASGTDTANFNNGANPATVTLTVSETVGAISVQAAQTGTVTIQSGGTQQVLVLGTGGTNTNAILMGSVGAGGSLIIGGPGGAGITLALNGNAGFQNNSAGQLILNGTITAVTGTATLLTLQNNQAAASTIINSDITNGTGSSVLGLTINNGNGVNATQLNGNNSYTGATLISGQSSVLLQGTLGGGTGGGTAITDTAGKNFTESSTGAIAGTSSFSVTGGTVNFAGTNTYTGTTSINNAAFNLTGVLGSGGGTAISLSTGGILTESVTGSISGGSSLSLNSDSVNVNLAGNNTYTGATNVNGGSLTVSGTTGAITGGALTLGGTGAFNLSNSTGTATSSFTSTLINAGSSFINNTVAGDTLALGAITRGDQSNVLGQVNFGNLTGNITTTTVNTNGILGTWATTGTGTMLSYATEFGGSIIALDDSFVNPFTGDGTTVNTGNYYSDGDTTLTASEAVNTLQLIGSGQTIATGTNTLTVGGLMNSGSGTMTISGTLAFNSSGRLDIVSNSSATIISANIEGNSNSRFEYGGPNAGLLTLSGSDSVNAFYINSGSVLLTGTFSGQITTIGNSNAAFSESSTGQIIGAGGLTLNTNTTTTLAGTNTFSGAFFYNLGTLILNSNGAAGTGAFNLGSSATGATFTLDNTSGSTVTLTNTGTGTWYGFTYLGTGGSTLNVGTGTISLATSDTFNIANGTFIIGGSIINTKSLTKSGAGTLVLNGASTYTGGTTVASGTLVVGNTSGSATGTGFFTLNTGATLMGAGSINSAATNTVAGKVTVGTGGTDTTSVLTITSTGTTTFAGANLTFNLSSLAAGQGNSVNLQGTPTIKFGTGAGGTTLTFNLVGSGPIADGTDYLLFSATSGSQYADLTQVGGKFTNFSLIFDGTTDGISNQIYYGDSSIIEVGGNIELQIEGGSVPEPGTWALMLGGLGFLLAYQKTRRSKDS